MRLPDILWPVKSRRYVNYFGYSFVATLALLLLLRDSLYTLHPTLTLLYVFSPYWFLPVPGLLIVALVLRARGTLLAGLLAILVFLFHFHFLGRLIPVRADELSAQRLIVANLNLGPGQAQPEEIVAALRASGADLIGLQELTESTVRQIESDIVADWPG